MTETVQWTSSMNDELRNHYSRQPKTLTFAKRVELTAREVKTYRGFTEMSLNTIKKQLVKLNYEDSTLEEREIIDTRREERKREKEVKQEERKREREAKQTERKREKEAKQTERKQVAKSPRSMSSASSSSSVSGNKNFAAKVAKLSMTVNSLSQRLASLTNKLNQRSKSPVNNRGRGRGAPPKYQA